MRIHPAGLFLPASLAILFLAAGKPAHSHCQVPCGIYTDELRFRMLEEHFTTIEKSMKQIVKLSGKPERNGNQIARWVSNKDSHADEVSQIITWYFMAQRIKPGQDDYEAKITILHRMLILSMKCKQTTDTNHLNSLRGLTVEFAAIYLKPEDQARLSRDIPAFGSLTPTTPPPGKPEQEDN